MFINDAAKDTVSSFVRVPPPKMSSPAQKATDLSRSSSGGNPQVLTYRKFIS